MSKYPRIMSRGTKPRFQLVYKEQTEREKNPKYGKPCVICGDGTTRRVWVQVSWFRGDDEELRVCCDCWNTPTTTLLIAYEKQENAECPK